ncbi:phage integrase family protein [Ochrobactrum sp. Kaboul]|nr:phage integrase family protein [Ochrobactrum sp. Kaboul]
MKGGLNGTEGTSFYESGYSSLRRIEDIASNDPSPDTIVLTNTRKAPWTVNGFGSSFSDCREEAKLDDRDLHFHDFRGTAATKFYIAGLSERVIAEIMGWEEETVRNIIRRYVSRTAAIEATIKQIDEARKRT